MRALSLTNTLFLKGIMALAVFSICFLACEENTPTTKKVAVTGITVAKDATSTLKGSGTKADPVLLILEGDATVQFTAMVAPTSASNKEVTWSSKKEEIASVDETGKVKGKKVASDTVEIVATTQDGGKTASIFLKVIVANPAKSVAIGGTNVQTAGGKKTLTLEVGAKETLTATLELTDATADATDVLKWTSSDKDKATVDANGSVTAKADGKVKIAATAGKATDTVELTITAHVLSVEITGDGLTGTNDAKTATLATTTATLQLTAEVLPADANQGVTWSSSNKDIAIVSENGEVTGVDQGTAIITATSKDNSSVSASVTVTVPVPAVIPVSSIKITGYGKSSEAVTLTESTLQLTANVSPDDATVDQGVTWSSSDPSIATVSEDGEVTGVGEGTATITATSKGTPSVSASVTVTVPPPAPAAPSSSDVSSVEITGSGVTGTDDAKTVTLKKDALLQLIATVSPDDADNPGITWSSSDASIVTVADSGVITGIKAGKATITATSDSDTSISASVTVTVSE